MGHIHEGLEHLAFECTRVFHTDHHTCQQAFKHAGRRKVIGWANLFQVDHHRAGGLGAVHHIATGQPLRVAEDVLANPGRWQVGQHFFVAGEFVEFGTRLGTVNQAAVGVHHPFRVACGAGREKHRCHIGSVCLGNLVLEEGGVAGREALARCEQLIQRCQTGFVVVAQAAWVVVVNVGQLRAALAHLQHLVDLLLVFHEAETHLGIGDREHTLCGCRVLVQRHGDGPQRLRRQHGGRQARAVGADDDHVFTPLQPGLVQATGQVFHQRGHVGPAAGLPDAVFLLAHGGRTGALGGMFEQQPGERAGLCGRGGLH